MKRTLKIFSRSTLIFLEVMAVAAGLALLAGGVSLWRLTTGPVDISFARGYIEEALRDPVSGYSVLLDGVVIEWPDRSGPLMLDLDKVNLEKQGRTVLSVDNVNLGLSMRHLVIGRIEPIKIILTEPSLQLVRTENNAIHLGLEEDAEETEQAAQTGQDSPLMDILDTLSQPEGTIDKRSPVDNLESVEIRKARMVMEDHLLGITWFLSPIDLTFARDREGLMMTASVELPGGRDRAARVQADFVYSREQKDFAANIHVQDFNPHVVSRKVEALDWLNDHYTILNGNIALNFDASFTVSKAQVSLSSMNGELGLEGAYDEPLPYEEMFLDATYDKVQGKADIRQFSVKAGGVNVILSSPVTFTDTSVRAPVTIKIPELPQDKIAPLWPDALRGEGAEIWLTQKLSGGRFFDAQAAFNIEADKKDDTWEVDVKDIAAGFAIEDMNIDYRAPLKPVTAANGSGKFENDTLTIDIAAAKIMDMDISGGKVAVDRVIEGGGHADVKIDLKGPLQSVLRYIGPEPIGMSEEDLGLKIAEVKGHAELSVGVNFPTIRDLLAEQVKVKAGGTLSDVLLPDVVKTLDLSGGPLKLTVADGAASIEGKGKLEGRDIAFSWKEYVSAEGKPFSSQVKASLVADGAIREKMGVGLEDWIDGAFPVDVVYTEYGGGRSEVDVNTDLTPGRLMIGPFKHEKPAGTQGRSTCKILLQEGNVKEVQNLVVDTPTVKMSGGRFVFDTVKDEAVLRQGEIPSFTLEENNLKLEFEVGQSGLLKISATGAFLDARPFLADNKGEEPYDGPPVLLSASVDKMRTHPERTVGKAKIYLDMNKEGDVRQFEMDAVAGAGAIYLRLKPNEKGVMSIRLEADDAGATLRAFDMYENVKGGKIVLYGEAPNVNETKMLVGHAELTDFHVVNAPVLAQLLSAISLFGIQQLLGGDGIYFSRLESQFEWHIRRQGDKYVVKEGRTSGSSLGLTFDGRIDKSIDRIDLKGTIVPVSMVNDLIGSIPLIGDILTGGGGGIIAATYELGGPVKKPEVSVNPLSALAPGILRKILFE